MVKIFEACNFQDLTGQRITKVVGDPEIHRDAHRAHDGDLGRARRLQGHRGRDASRRARATPGCSTARRSTARSATPRRTTSTRCLPDATVPHVLREAGEARRRADARHGLPPGNDQNTLARHFVERPRPGDRCRCCRRGFSRPGSPARSAPHGCAPDIRVAERPDFANYGPGLRLTSFRPSAGT